MPVLSAAGELAGVVDYTLGPVCLKRGCTAHGCTGSCVKVNPDGSVWLFLAHHKTSNTTGVRELTLPASTTAAAAFRLLVGQAAPVLRASGQTNCPGVMLSKGGEVLEGANSMSNIVKNQLAAIGCENLTARSCRKAGVVAVMDAGAPRAVCDAIAVGRLARTTVRNQPLT